MAYAPTLHIIVFKNFSKKKKKCEHIHSRLMLINDGTKWTKRQFQENFFFKALRIYLHQEILNLLLPFCASA